MCNNYPKFLNKIVTDDKSWCFVYNPKIKCESATWVDPGSLPAKKLCFQKLRVKTILITFFDSKGIYPLGMLKKSKFIDYKR